MAANKDWPRGLVPVQGGPSDWEYFKVDTTGTAIFKGQLVTMSFTTGGGINGLAAAITRGDLKFTTHTTVQGVGPASPILGVCMEYYPAVNANKPARIAVCRAYPGTKFLIQHQTDTTTARAEEDFLFNQFWITSIDDGNTDTGCCSMEALANTTAFRMTQNPLAPLTCIGIAPENNNKVALANPDLIVTINPILLFGHNPVSDAA